MKTGPVAEHLQNVCGRINYGSRLRIDDPWKLLGMAVLLQGALDFINGFPEPSSDWKPGTTFLASYQFYANLVGLEMPADEFLGLVYDQFAKTKHNTKTATAFLDCYI